MAALLPETTTSTTGSYPDIELMFDLDTVLSGADNFGYSDQIPAPLSLSVAPFLTVSAADSCAVCIEDFRPGDTGKMIPCGHVYHETCITSWLAVGDTCPLCRRRISGQRSEKPKTL